MVASRAGLQLHEIFVLRYYDGERRGLVIIVNVYGLQRRVLAPSSRMECGVRCAPRGYTFKAVLRACVHHNRGPESTAT